MIARIESFFIKRSWLLPLIFAFLFVLITLPGIDWGVPSGWHPDELIQRVLKALNGDWAFDEINFDYPSLPKYAMFWLGRLIEGWGFGESEIMLAARKLSVQLGAAIVVISYAIARKLGLNIWGASLAALLVLSSSELAQHARYAHNDIYITFFIALAVLVSINIIRQGNQKWLYISAFFVGLAASSKYNGGALLLLPITLFLISKAKEIWTDKFSTLESLGISGLLAFAGFALGTPKALFWMAFYFKRLTPALQRHANFGFRQGRDRGLLGQWEVLQDMLGVALFWIALLAVGYLLFKSWQYWKEGNRKNALQYLTIPLALLAFDLPIMISYNYPARFFLPMLPLLAVAVAMAATALWEKIKSSGGQALPRIFLAVVLLLISYSFTRVASISLLFQNDSRSAASDFLAEISSADSIEYTLYPPTIDKSIFLRSHNFPIFFIKNPGDTVPEGKIYEFNTGAAGIAERQSEYLAFDSFTYLRFEDEYICELNPLNCQFFTDLLGGQTDYQEIAFFKYDLPEWLPNLEISFVNPDIKIFRLSLDP